MKQVLATGAGTKIEEIPAPHMGPNDVLVQTHFSLISTGTETSGMSADKSKPTSKLKTLAAKTIEQPKNLLLAAKMLVNEGWAKTISEIQKAMGGGMGWPTGYSLSGTVIRTGANVKDLTPGDRVACAGAGRANHAEVVSVPRNLVVKIPADVSFENAASVTLGAIAMQGVRQANPKLGETVAVIGLGLIGQITVQLLKAAGTRVIGIDLDDHRLETAHSLGADHIIHGTKSNPVEDALRYTKNHGVDSTIITAATPSSVPLQQSMQMTRQKGTVVIVGAVGLDLERSPFYQKEIDLKISCSYGPGRYDSNYEEKGIDYPYGYVRWTENRNMQSYLDIIAEKKLDFEKLVEKTYEIDNAPHAYQELLAAERKPLAVLLKYPADPKAPQKTSIQVNPPTPHTTKKKINLAVIGAGAFFQGMHLPIIQKLNNYYHLHTVWNRIGTKAKEQASIMKFENATTSYEEILKNPEIDGVFICTRHDTHADLVKQAIAAQKAVFVEKPLATTTDELAEIRDALKKTPTSLLTGFNRRFSPHSRAIKKILANRTTPLIINYRLNGPFLPADHWTQTEEGKGRIIGEACHMFDIFNYLTDSEPVEIHTSSITPGESHYFNHDNFITTIKYSDGSVCSLTYTALGAKDCPKERVEIFNRGKTFIIDDYKTLTAYGIDLPSEFAYLKTNSKTDKGHTEEITQWAHYLKGEQKEPPITLEQQFLATEISIAVEDQTRK